MRESEIRLQQNRAARIQGTIVAQLEFLNSRMLAFEKVLFTSSLSERLRYAKDPTLLKDVVDCTQRMLLDQSRQQLAQAKEEAQLKDKIQVVKDLPRGVGINGKVEVH